MIMLYRLLYFVFVFQLGMIFPLSAQQKASLVLKTSSDKEFMYWYSGSGYLSDYEQGFGRSEKAKTDSTGSYLKEFSLSQPLILNLGKLNNTIMSVLPVYLTPGCQDTVIILNDKVIFQGTNTEYNRCLQKTEAFLDYCNQLLIGRPSENPLYKTKSLSEFNKLLNERKIKAEKEIKYSGLESAFVEEQLEHIGLGCRLAFFYKVLFNVPDSLQTADWKKAAKKAIREPLDIPYFLSFREVGFLLSGLLALDYKIENGGTENLRKMSFECFGRLARYFKGKNLEYAWATLINDDIVYQTYNPIVPELYELLKERFPENSYKDFLAAGIEANNRFNAIHRLDSSDKNYRILSCDSSFHSLADVVKTLQGKVIYVNLWATWCNSCLNEFPYLPQVEKRLKDLDITFLYISLDKPENRARWEKSIPYYKLKGYHLLATPMLTEAICKEFGNYIPHCFIVDKTGNIVERNAPELKQTDSLFKQLSRWSK